ncbi:TetR/AcrR family transcriptional regulator [Actinacidiphila bryophytorum]|uniref:Transcriptional regulator, TetR family n=2 Tax=Actinacidiphila bryophytorum TaxID=1436133 RepID=A0A9W4E5S1_9ACTN|nr:TetR family transcriptional regulator [Actinacidiphila bryophytorum]MBM9436492.1 TetR family transcriptional regulator [Actinacidiphila bryophytorum]CAG7600990.1 Transcriptional regulator, TetR family [Actinacidiphila bryophytorum]
MEDNSSGTTTGPAAGPAEELPGGRARPKTGKSEQTRALILETAMRLFRERGYDKTTMRAIAQEAGVSVGNAYYYFESKEFLIQGFYDQMTYAHALDATARMAGERDFDARLRISLESWLDCAADYHEFAAQFFRTAADPDSSLSPFSNESHPARATAVDLFRDVLNGSDLAPRLDAELAELLPDLLWLHLMVVVLYWVFDRTPDTARTREFVRRSTPLVAKLIALSRYRVFRPMVRDAKSLIQDFILPTIGRTAATRTPPPPPRRP